MIITVTPNTSIDRSVEVPNFAVGATQLGRVIARHPAGKGVNVSLCLAALGCPSVACGMVGVDERGRFRQLLEQRGVRDQLVEVQGETRCNVTVLDPVARTETHLRELGFPVASSQLEALRTALEHEVNAGDTVVLAGSLPPGMEPEHLVELIETVRGRQATVIVDTGGAALRKALRHRPDMIKPNRAELRELTGQDFADVSQLAEVAHDLSKSVTTVVVTMGADGALVVDAHEAWLARVAVREARHSVGSGDALLAGYLLARERGLPLAERLRWGVACGAAATQHRIAGELDPANVQDLLRQTELTRLR